MRYRDVSINIRMPITGQKKDEIRIRFRKNLTLREPRLNQICCVINLLQYYNTAARLMPCRSETKIPLSGYIRQIQGLQNLG